MWTTGTASGGNSQGVGGTPAQVSQLPRQEGSRTKALFQGCCFDGFVLIQYVVKRIDKGR